ncbi:SMP-30/gluconolactonase/LRE family protein [Acuticoccus sp. M5D2P5]|uniref:SMP-30/gluconolactonase/LRE family protein n=1 Tax=Acuticoccus kalidii TaxID=2910977 RepID=UPI001F23F1FD|nr:SMP-30/gluconolactonase/LRE family protein [Acuticoccus kalidii]MCF3936732.1 SMP-30/gluconolactonase/LRE family protein [Acuticoccus kalidii]
MKRPSIELSALRFHGGGLKRPECVLAHQSGLLFTADWTGGGGVSILAPESGAVTRLLAAPDAGLKPNGVLLDDDGSFLLTDLGETTGGVFRLTADGRHTPVLTEMDGRPLPPSNFAAKDAEGRLYVTVSTRHIPRHLASRADIKDGFILMAPPGGAPQIVADGLGYTNECVFDAAGAFLYVNETFGRETSRFPVRADGTLGRREVVARYGRGVFPDGLVFDTDGALWITSIVSNSVIRLDPDGTLTTILDDADPDRVEAVERAYQANALTRTELDLPHDGPLKNISSLAFGGPDRRTAYLGCLLGDRIASFEAPVVGAEPAHWRADLTPLQEAGVLPADAA